MSQDLISTFVVSPTQYFPPNSGFGLVHVLDCSRDCVPFSHVTLQADHSEKSPYSDQSPSTIKYISVSVNTDEYGQLNSLVFRRHNLRLCFSNITVHFLFVFMVHNRVIPYKTYYLKSCSCY